MKCVIVDLRPLDRCTGSETDITGDITFRELQLVQIRIRLTAEHHPSGRAVVERELQPRLMHEVDRGLRKVLELSWAPVDKSAYVTHRRRMNRNPTNTTDAQTGLCTV